MSQISPPIRILVIAMLGLVSAYMLLLRPKTEETVPPTPTPAGNLATGKPAETSAGKLVEKAQQAAGATNAQGQSEIENSGTGSDAATAPSTAAKTDKKDKAPAAATADGVSLAGVPAAVRKPLAANKVLVLLFWNKDSSDDRVVRRQLRDVSRWHGMVVVRQASIKDVSKYGRLTRGANVAQSPTTLVVDRNLKVTSLVGFVDTKSIDQAAFDAMRNSGGYLKNAYLKKVNAVCGAFGSDARFMARPNKFSQLGDWATSGTRVLRRLDKRFAAVAAPKQYRSFKAATVRDHKFLVGYYADWAAYLGKKPTATRFLAGAQRFSAADAQFGKVTKRYDKRMAGENLVGCGAGAE